MRTYAPVWVASVVLLAVGTWCLDSGSGSAAQGSKLADAIQKLADKAAKSDAASTRNEAEALAKTVQLESVMYLFELRTKEGLGVGSKPGAIMPDGIEMKIMALAKKPLSPQELEAEAEGLTQAGYVVAVTAQVAQHKCPVPVKMGEKDPKQWQEWTEQLHKAALELAAAAKAKQPMELQTAAAKVNSSCNNCHGVFRD